MVKKTSPAKKKTKSVAKKPAVIKTKKQDASLKFNKNILLVLVPILLIAGFIGYNKYLDYRNVQDMKQLLSDFEQLEKDLELKTGEEFSIESDCSSGGKFASFYSCNIYLKNPSGKLYEYDKFIQNIASFSDKKYRCRIVDGEGARYLNFYSCILSVRNSVVDRAEDVFFRYDTTPGRSF